MYQAYHSGSRIFEHVYVKEIPFNKVLISRQYNFILNDNYFYIFSFISFITVFYFI